MRTGTGSTWTMVARPDVEEFPDDVHLLGVVRVLQGHAEEDPPQGDRLPGPGDTGVVGDAPGAHRPATSRARA
ncbi:hypothetical protein GCM10027294_30820 [Marinactinospora endophytica]